MRGAAFVIAAAVAACSPGSAPPAAAESQVQGQAQTGLERVPLTIRSATGVHQFQVDIARTPEQQQRGLMFVTALDPNEGMIFPYDVPQPVAFWMRNTLIPLDMIFIREDGTIARISTAVPHSETPMPSGEPVVAVLEIAGGRAAELGIREGDRVEWVS